MCDDKPILHAIISPPPIVIGGGMFSTLDIYAKAFIIHGGLIYLFPHLPETMSSITTRAR